MKTIKTRITRLLAALKEVIDEELAVMDRFYEQWA